MLIVLFYIFVCIINSLKMKGVTFEKDKNGKNRYVRFDLKQHGERLRPILEDLGEVQTPEGWDDALTTEEFLAEAKKLIRQKFEERNKV